MSAVAAGIIADAVLIGGASAQASAAGEENADTGGCAPGDSAAAGRRAAELGLGDLPATFGGADGGAGGDLPDIAGDMGDGYLNVVSRVLAGWDPDTAADELGDMLGDAVADGPYAAALTATRIEIVVGRSALQWYLNSGAQLLQWYAGPGACPICLDNAAADPRPPGVLWPGGVAEPLQHPSCGCFLAVVQGDSSGTAPGKADDADAGEDLGDDEEGDDDSEAEEDGDSGDDEVSGDEGAEADRGPAGAEPGEAGPPGPVKDFTPLKFSTAQDAQGWLAEHTPDFTPDQGEAVKWYTGPGAYTGNGPLRAGAELPDDVAAQVAALDSAMAPLPADLVLSRMVDLDAFPGTADLADLEGQLITDPAFMSTSLGPAIKDAGTDVLMHIAAPEGTPGVITGTASRLPKQREIVLARGTRLAVARAEQNDSGMWEMWLTVVPGE